MAQVSCLGLFPTTPAGRASAREGRAEAGAPGGDAWPGSPPCEPVAIRLPSIAPGIRIAQSPDPTECLAPAFSRDQAQSDGLRADRMNRLVGWFLLQRAPLRSFNSSTLV